MAKLVLLNTEKAGTEYALEPGKKYLLGRNEDCQIMLNNIAGISRHHASFEFDDDKKAWVVKDLGSQNGIYWNKDKITSRALEDRDSLWFSSARIRFEDVPANTNKSIYFEQKDEAPPEPPKKESKQPEPTKSEAPKQPVEPPKEAAPLPKLDDVSIDPEQIRKVREYATRIEAEFAKVIVGQRAVLELLMTALLASGHALMIGLPGLAKTLMVSTLSKVLDLRFKRIQFTPDLMPSDIIGSDVLELDEDTGRKSFRFIEGPIFTNMLLADEINRTPPKTQAALLEAMQERQVTASNQLFPLPEPFFVLATQNPLEQEGTYPLPEAQLDRFMFNIIVDYPAEDEEEQIVMQTTRRQTGVCEAILSGDQLLQLQDVVRDLPASPHVVKYATRLTRATRPTEDNAPDYIKEHVSCGAGPRAAQFLVLGAKARAVLHGSLNVSCEDVRALALPILRHRIYTNFTAESEGITPDDLIKRLLLSVAEPSAKDY